MNKKLIAAVVKKAKALAADYYRLTGKPLGVTGEIGEYEAARLLKLTLEDARTAGYDATDKDGVQYQIKSRSIPKSKMSGGQRLGAVKFKYKWDNVLVVLMDENLDVQEIWEANRKAMKKALDAPGSVARNERGQLGLSKFKSIGKQVWPVKK